MGYLTRSELKDALEMAQNRADALEDSLASARSDARSAEGQAVAYKAALEGLAAREKDTGVTVYVARSSEGQPTCIYADGTDSDNDLAVNLYLDEGRNIRGVVVVGIDGEVVAGAGLVPFDMTAGN
jgi:hypothetical protein